MKRQSRKGLSGYALAAVMLLTRTAGAGPAPAHDDHGTEVARPAIVVFAAASLTDALEKLGGDFGKSTGIGVKFTFAASSVLARQIEAGAPADIFFSADRESMDYLQSRKLIQAESRRDLLGHPPIVYPIALTVTARSVAAQFADYLSKPAAGAVFARYGFTPRSFTP